MEDSSDAHAGRWCRRSSTLSIHETHADAHGDDWRQPDGPEERHRPPPGRVSVRDRLERAATVSFAGRPPADAHEYPDTVSVEARCRGSIPRSLKQVLATLPEANSGELWPTNEFVSVDGIVDTEATRSVPGPDIDDLETATGRSLHEPVDTPTADPLVRVRDPRDVVDRRRDSVRGVLCDPPIPSTYNS